jgi:hypothetical protein
MTIDILAVGAHPDDAEIWCGGLLLKLNDRGYRTRVVDLTRGEMGSRGTPEVRRQELMAAAEALSLDHVEVLDFQDCRVTDDFQERLNIAAVVRRLRPTLVLAPHWDGPQAGGSAIRIIRLPVTWFLTRSISRTSVRCHSTGSRTRSPPSSMTCFLTICRQPSWWTSQTMRNRAAAHLFSHNSAARPTRRPHHSGPSRT